MQTPRREEGFQSPPTYVLSAHKRKGLVLTNRTGLCIALPFMSLHLIRQQPWSGRPSPT